MQTQQNPIKTCSICKEQKPRTEFYSKGLRKGKPVPKHRCKKCDNKRRDSKRRDKNRLPFTLYQGQVERSIKRGHPRPAYSGKELKEWLYQQEDYHRIHAEWVRSGYLKKLAPSVDRLDDYKPYSFDNIRIVTWEENNRSHNEDRINGINNKTNKTILQLSLDGKVINRFHSREEAGRVTGFNTSYIGACANGKHKTAYGYRWMNEEVRHT